MAFAAIAPLAVSLIGSLLSGAGGAGKQGGIEPTLAPGWQSLFGQWQNALGAARRPTFDQGSIANLLQKLNVSGQGAQNQLLQGLAGAGGLNAGRAAASLGNLAASRTGQLAQFFAGLPMQEREAQSKRVADLLGVGAGFIGGSKGGQYNIGPSAGSGVLGNLGLLATAGGFGVGPMGNLGSLFTKQTPTSNIPWPFIANLPTSPSPLLPDFTKFGGATGGSSENLGNQYTPRYANAQPSATKFAAPWLNLIYGGR